MGITTYHRNSIGLRCLAKSKQQPAMRLALGATSFAAPLSKWSLGQVFAVFAGPLSSLWLEKFLNVVFDCDCHNHIQGVAPVDVEEELHATSFAPRYSVRTDIGHVNWR